MTEADKRIAAITDKDKERFFSKIQKQEDGCWIWKGCKDKGGYGYIGIKGSTLKAHRVAKTLESGPIPHGMFVCHHCDNPPCCNPDHLFIGTNTDNVRDAKSKGRLATGNKNGGRLYPERNRRFGSSNNKTVLDESKVIEIRRLRDGG